MESKVKESLELIASLEATVGIVAKILEDGKVGITDIRYVPGLVANLREGLKGAKDIPAEVKNMSKEDLEKIVDAVIALGMKVYEEFSKMEVPAA